MPSTARRIRKIGICGSKSFWVPTVWPHTHPRVIHQQNLFMAGCLVYLAICYTGRTAATPPRPPVVRRETQYPATDGKGSGRSRDDSGTRTPSTEQLEDRRRITISDGDLVHKANTHMHVGKGQSSKIKDRFVGPYRVMGTRENTSYLIQNVKGGSGQCVHRMQPTQNVLPACQKRRQRSRYRRRIKHAR